MAAFSSNVSQMNGSMMFEDCTAPSGGGGMSLSGSRADFNSSATFFNCSTGQQVKEGTEQESDFSDPFGGGGLAAKDTIIQHSGELLFLSCSCDLLYRPRDHCVRWLLAILAMPDPSQSSLFFKHIAMSNSHDALCTASPCRFDRCSSTDRGGAVYLSEVTRWVQAAGVLNVTRSKAVEGGGISLRKSSQFQQLAGEMHLKNCSATSSGGGLHFSSEASFESESKGIIQLENCEATARGGCLDMVAGQYINITGTVSFVNCTAREKPAMYAEANVTVSHAIVQDAHATDHYEWTSIYASKGLDINRLQIRNKREERFVAASEVLIRMNESANCTSAKDVCMFVAPSLKVPRPYCCRGKGFQNIYGMLGCVECQHGHMQLVQNEKTTCTQCPEGVEVCNASTIKMTRGFMTPIERNQKISSNNIIVHRCPNAFACPGGQLPYDVSSQMCAPGFTGFGCVHCQHPTHAMSDADVLSCTKCATGWVSRALQFLFLIGKDTIIFVIACRGGLGAVDSSGKQRDAKTSSYLLNQFLAFCTVASIALTAAAILSTNAICKMFDVGRCTQLIL